MITRWWPKIDRPPLADVVVHGSLFRFSVLEASNKSDRLRISEHQSRRLRRTTTLKSLIGCSTLEYQASLLAIKSQLPVRTVTAPRGPWSQHGRLSCKVRQPALGRATQAIHDRCRQHCGSFGRWMLSLAECLRSGREYLSAHPPVSLPRRSCIAFHLVQIILLSSFLM
jgi:hypothetical protein